MESLRFKFIVARHDLDAKVVRPLRRKVAGMLPRWLMVDALIRSSSAIRPYETIPDVPFMDVYSRWFHGEEKKDAIPQQTSNAMGIRE